MGTCCPCPPSCFPQTGACSHGDPACAQQHHSSSRGTTTSGLTQPRWVSHLHTPPLLGSAGPRGSLTGSAEGPSASLPCPRQPWAHQFLATHCRRCSGTYSAEFPAGITAVLGVLAEGDLPGQGAPAREISFLGLGGSRPNPSVTSHLALSPAGHNGPYRGKEPESAGFEPKAEAAAPLDSAWSLLGLGAPAISLTQGHCG